MHKHRSRETISSRIINSKIGRVAMPLSVLVEDKGCREQRLLLGLGNTELIRRVSLNGHPTEVQINTTETMSWIDSSYVDETYYLRYGRLVVDPTNIFAEDRKVNPVKSMLILAKIAIGHRVES